MSEAEWVDLYAGYLTSVKYSHLGGELVSTQEEGHKAQVILKSSVSSVNGITFQHEIYDLVKGDGGWLIDYIDIRDENFGTAIGPEPARRFDSKNSTPSPKHAP